MSFPDESISKDIERRHDRQRGAKLSTHLRCFAASANLLQMQKSAEASLSGFKLSDLHNCWELLKARGRLFAEHVPLPVQAALKELGLVEIDWFTQDLVLTEAALVGPRKVSPRISLSFS